MAPSIKHRIWIVTKTAALIAGGVVAFQIFAPQVRSTKQFLPFDGDGRVRFEAGAEKAAKVIAQALPQAVGRVELAHGRTFAKPVAVFVCATEESFERYGLRVEGAGGYVHGGRLFLSPKPQNTAERLPRILTHELSHLHLEQRTGMWWGASHLPGWFKEGLAVFVSQGGGAENVSEAEAREAISRGRIFRCEDTGSLLFPQTGARDGLPAHLFYRESAMFVAFLERRSPAAFHGLLMGIQERAGFAAAVRENYGSDLSQLWIEFEAETKAASKLVAP